MKIAWCTPLARSCGISKYSLAAVSTLASRLELEVFAPPTGDDYACPWVPVRPLHAGDSTRRALSDFDLVVYNTGNNPSFHMEIHRLLEQVPGVVIIHDKRMHGFFHYMWAVSGRDPARYAALMRYYYGPEGEATAAEVLSGRLGVDDFESFPLVEPALWNASGIVVHSREAMSLIDRYGSMTPILEVGLPFDLTSLGELGEMPARSSLVPDDGRVLLVSTGGVFEQKRLDSVLCAFAADDRLRASARLAFVGGGRPAYLKRLGDLAVSLGIADVLTITGRVSDAEMYAWIRAADVAVNLRYPSMESASLSLVEQLFFGKPVIVTDTSYYAELPAAVAIKIPVEGEVETLRVALRELATDSERRENMGAAAAELAAQLHAPEVYATKFVAFAEGLLPKHEVAR